MPLFHDPSLVLPAQKRLSVLFAVAGLYCLGIGFYYLYLSTVEIQNGDLHTLDIRMIVILVIFGVLSATLAVLPGILLLAAAKGIRCGRDWARRAGMYYIVTFGLIGVLLGFLFFDERLERENPMVIFLLLPGVVLAVLMLVGFVDLGIAEWRRNRRATRK